MLKASKEIKGIINNSCEKTFKELWIKKEPIFNDLNSYEEAFLILTQEKKILSLKEI